MPTFRPVSYRSLLMLSSSALGIYWLTLLVLTHLSPDLLSRALSSFFAANEEMLDEGGDKTAHFLAYGGLAFLFASWLWIRGVEDKRRWKITFVTLSAYAVVDELLQIPFHRTASVADCLADWTGVAIGYLCFLAVRLLIVRLGLAHPSASIDPPDT